MKLLKSYSKLGITQSTEPHLHRSIILSNHIALIIFILILLLLLVLLLLVGFTPTIQRALFSLLICVAVPVLNNLGFNLIARLLVSTFLPLYIIGLIASASTSIPLSYTASYFPPRVLTLTTCIIPMIVFDTLREKRWMLLAAAICMFCTIGYDFLINLFGREINVLQNINTFIYYNTIFALEFFALVIAAYMLKRAVDKVDNKNLELLDEKEKINTELKEQNLRLQQLNLEVEKQNQEILAQSEELIANQEKLGEAYQLIQNQKEQLHVHNESLEGMVAQKNAELIQANEELFKHNNELRQFSYTVSHNLRAPVARLLGLENILSMKADGMTAEQMELLGLLNKSSIELDAIIRDLNKIIDIRNDIYRLREKVNFEQEFEKVKLLLEHQTSKSTEINADFSNAPFIYAVRPMINSILYNLLSNAIKYRSQTRELIINIKTTQLDHGVELSFSDNGLGMNLEQFGNDLFGMYKRFHTHTDGKGLGLYLVKSQVEALSGNISVSSELNKGTQFKMYFKTPEGIEGQVCLDSEYGSIYYNALTNTAGMSWKKQVTSIAYRELFNKSLEILRLYNTPYWISDLRKQGSITPEDQIWMVTTIIPEAVRHGLIRIVGVYDPVQHNEDYRVRIKAAIEKAGALVHFCTSSSEAEDWIEAQIQEKQNKPKAQD